MLLVNLLQQLFLLEELFLENNIMEPIICLIIEYLLENIGEQGFTFFVKGQNPIFTLFWVKSTKNNFERGVACEPEALMVAALGGLVYFMSICVKIPVKICVGALFKQQCLF